MNFRTGDEDDNIVVSDETPDLCGAVVLSALGVMIGLGALHRRWYAESLRGSHGSGQGGQG
jgi:hypothetical protein